ncbi:dihydroorotase [Pelagovum pacificum]|uniref:Amidohydrolase family protein n=1 Tax=Pelagovum pacificum TaxID=2588711 RepID=A0A5C5GAJ5_9RHOB|nr:amidohydrolase family protein [Pelagovum pacificum]QQA41982.1 amidohydrolase family protein [Pelagovum pacificum]TNY30577.1 amidohydrolase family protein [Pelagovum pacificum]
MFDRIVKGTVVAEDATIENGWIAILDGRIAAIGQGRAPAAAEIDDHGRALILPGVVDGQTHATSYKGLPGIEDTTRSAIAGGVTTLVDMPYDNPVPLDRIERFDEKADAVGTYAHADMALYATVTREAGVDNVRDLIQRGAVAFKISSFESSPTRFPRIGEDLTLDLFEALAASDLPLGLHNEDQEIVHARMARAREAGIEGIEAHSTSRPPAAELAATAQFYALGQAVGAHAHPVHITLADGFELTNGFAAMGARATGEICVHYLWFDAAADGERLGARMKVNPPIRPGAIEGLWRALETGKVAFVSSDHSSWPIDNKLTESIFDAGAGIPGLETLLPSFFTLARKRGHDAPRMTADFLCARPARFFGIADRKGSIRVGLEADLAVLAEEETEWDEAEAHDGLNWSPFHGETFSVRVVATYLRGAPGWDGSTIVNSPGAGRVVKRATGGWYAERRNLA